MKQRNKKITERRKRRVLSGVLAVLLIVALAVGLMPNEQVYAAETSADSETRSDYTWSLGNLNSTRYNGRVWTDKSVSTTDVTFDGGNAGSVTVPIGTGDDASDFLVTYSALATSQQVSGESNVPVDVVFVIDISGSMSNGSSYMDNGQKRIQNLVTALNTSINELMDMNPENRIGVVGYSSEATTILPLDHYTPWSSYNQNIFSYNDNRARLSWDARNSSNQHVNNNASVTGGTNTQMGIYQGMKMLASEGDTTVTVGGQEMQRVPSVIVMADGAATFSSSSTQWWSPSNNSGDGPGGDPYYGNGMKAMMTASYMKQAINRNYDVEDVSSNYAAKVYSIGIGTSKLTGDNLDLANITLNPKDHWNDNNDIANSIRNAWNGVESQLPWEQDEEGYTSNNGTGTPKIIVNKDWRGDPDYYELTHPDQYDIVDIGLQYNDAYYDAITAEDINTIFDDIVSSISINTPQVPTKIEGDDPVQSGYITYTDVIGDYMEVDSVKTLIWAGQRFMNPTVSGEGTDDVTYTFSGPINNPAYENAQNANQIQITVHTDTAADGTKTQTMTVKVPASAIPLRVNTIELNEDGSVYSNTSNEAYPLRLVYGVSLQDDIDPETLEGVSDAYIEANTDENGKVNFYSNKYSKKTQGAGDAAKTVGDAKVEFTPADNNPFYFLQENTPIYMNQTGDRRVTRNEFSTDGTYWVPITYYDGNTIVNTRVERSGSSMVNYIQYEEGENFWDPDYAYIEAGAPRLGNIEQFIQVKGTNTTGTAATSFYPTFEGTEVHDGKFVVYLGNNGKLQLDAPASLIIDKNVSADGLTAPDATFTFEITSNDKTSQTVSAVKTTGTGESASTEDVSVVFNEQGVATVELTADQTIELKGMAGADYSIKEIDIPNGFTLSDVTGADTESGNGNKTVASGTVDVGTTDETVTFTNNYSVTPVTSTDLRIPLGGTKTIDGRDFQQGDSFTFTIAAAQTTSEAPLPQKDGQKVTSVTISPTAGTSADFFFDGVITFTEPGEYRYIIRETKGNLAGVDYDTALFRLNIVIVDNGDGTLGLADVDEISTLTKEDGMVDDGLVYTANPMVQEYNGSTMQAAPNNAVQFDNTYNADAATASIQGTKRLNVTDSDYKLKDGDFTFTIEALGSTNESKDSYNADDFTADETQPMPVDNQGQPLTETTNIANGNVQFSFAQGAFTQEMRGQTFGYKITESLGNAPDTTVMDTSTTRIVWITVGDDGQGNVTATVGPNDGQEGSPNNFTFTNSYEPTNTTIGGDSGNAGITVQKTFNNHAWTSDYTFEYIIENTGAPSGVTAPMPEDPTIEIGNPASGNVNTNTFGAMTFEQEGTYTYKITETKGNHGGVTYDEHVATVTVTVTEDEAAGTLFARVTYNNDDALNASDQAVKTAAAFTNTYSATFDQDTAVNLDGTKNLTVGGNSNRTLGANQFFFVVTPLDGAPYGDNVINQGSSSYTVGNAADDEAENGVFTGTISGLLKNVKYQLSDLNGADSKDFVYLISEQQSGAQGMTYDGAVYRVTVTVTDDGNGTLSAGKTQIVKGSMQGDAFVADDDQTGVNGVVFNNSYTPNASDPVVTQTLKKVLSGDRNPGLQADEFEFKIELFEGDASGVTLPAPSTVKNNADGNINFGNITFTKAGTYKIRVTEVVPDGAVNNSDGTYTFNHVTYDTHTVESTFTVTDQNGKLTATRTDTVGSTIFTNTYQPDEITTTDDTSVDTNILVTKEVTGAPATEAFTFSLNLAEGQDGTNVFEGSGDDKTAFNGVEVTTSNNIAAGAMETKAFAGVTFTAAGDYKFVIDETTTTTKAGWTYDGDTAEITVHVEDQSGKLVITSIDGNKPTFTNSYTPNRVTLSGDSGLKATKSVTGAPALSEFEFNLALTSENTGNVLVGSGEDATEFPESGITMSTQGLFDEDTQTGSENATEPVSFGDLTFTATGVYTFTVTETTTTEADGWTYGSGSGAVITVTVTDDNFDGQLDATTMVERDGEQVDTNNPTIVNSYDPDSVTVGEGEDSGPIQVTKKIEGTAPAAEDFTFTLTFDPNAEGNTGKAENIQGLTDNSLTTSATKASLEDKTEIVSFGKLTFTEEGDYYFTVVETNQAAENSGWTYDNTPKTVIVHVTDTDHDGYLEATVDDDAAVVTNSYKAGSITIGDGTQTGIQVQKRLTGRDWQKGDSFEFTLTAQDNAPMPEDDGNKATIANASDPKEASFGAIKYDTEGTYRYTVSETKGSLGGVTYDTHTANVTVTITDKDYDGFLEVDSIVYDNNTEGAAEADKALTNIAAFTNVYDAGSTDVDTGKADFQLTKVLEGKAWNGDEFTFQIAADESNPGAPIPKDTEITVSQPTGKDKNGNDLATFSFGTITYDTPGTYVYKVTEVEGNNGGIDYSTNEATITVTVTDNNDGTYTTGVTVANNVFTNTYATELNYHTSGGLEIVKTFIGHDMDEFEFTVTPVAAADGSTTAQEAAAKLNINETGKAVSTKAAGASDTEVDGVPASVAKVAVLDSNDEAKFTQADEGKTYTYEVKEMPGSQSGVTYDDTVYTVTITTEDDGIGGITVTTTVTSDDGTSQAYTYDNNDQTDDQTAQVPFTNSYQATGELGGNGEVSINATKTLTNRPMTYGEFTFNVYNTADQDKTLVTTGTNDADGTITFDAIEYDVQQMLKDVEAELATAGTDDEDRDTYTYNYMVEEDAGNFVNGVSGVTTSFPVAVTVTDNNDGTLGIAVDYGNSDSLTFENAYGTSANAELNVNGTKVLETGMGANNAPDITDKYTFTISGTADDGTEAPLPEKTEATNDSAGNVDFGKITYTMQNVFGDDGTDTTAVEDEAATDESGQTQSGETEDEATDATVETTDVAGETNNEGIDLQSAERTKTFTYTVTETGTVAGVDNDPEATKTFTVTVKDNGNGTISVASDPEGAKFRFTNTYNVDPVESSPTGEGGITITKNLDGRNLNNGEFTFELADQSGTVVAKGTNDANGNVELETVKFTEPGTITYTIREVDNNLGGVDYDTAQYKATATVTDNSDGTLKVEWSFADAQGSPIDGTEITFNNTYKADATSVSLGAGKLIKGRDLKAGEFSFLLSDADGKEIDTAKNEENGAVTFKTITFDKAGTYSYEIREVLPEDDDSKTDGIQSSNVTYDENIYHVTVDVKDNTEKGCLEATVTYKDSDGAPVFVNTYTEPADDGDDVGIFGVKTGDPAETAILLTIMGVALAVIVAMSMILIRRHRR